MRIFETVLSYSMLNQKLRSAKAGNETKIKATSGLIALVSLNRPFPSSCLPPLQSESKCEVFVMVIGSTLHMNET